MDSFLGLLTRTSIRTAILLLHHVSHNACDHSQIYSEDGHQTVQFYPWSHMTYLNQRIQLNPSTRSINDARLKSREITADKNGKRDRWQLARLVRLQRRKFLLTLVYLPSAAIVTEATGWRRTERNWVPRPLNGAVNETQGLLYNRRVHALTELTARTFSVWWY